MSEYVVIDQREIFPCVVLDPDTLPSNDPDREETTSGLFRWSWYTVEVLGKKWKKFGFEIFTELEAIKILKEQYLSDIGELEYILERKREKIKTIEGQLLEAGEKE